MADKEWTPPVYYKEISLEEAGKVAQENLFSLRWGPNGKPYKVDFENPDYKKKTEARAEAKRKKRAEKAESVRTRIKKAYDRGLEAGRKQTGRAKRIEAKKAKAAKLLEEAKNLEKG